MEILLSLRMCFCVYMKNVCLKLEKTVVVTKIEEKIDLNFIFSKELIDSYK